MGTYFTNETLDALWVRLVDATKEVTGLTLSNTGVTGIHDALQAHLGFAHDVTPSTFGDYMKGIAVAARFYKNGLIDIESKNSLAEIVDLLEYKEPQPEYIFTLSESFYLTCDKPIYPYGDIFLSIYRDSEFIGEIQGVHGQVPFDFLSSTEDLWRDESKPDLTIPGIYYVTISWDDENGDHSYQSNEIEIEQQVIVPIISQNGDYIVIENIREIAAQNLDIREPCLIVPNPYVAEVMSKFSIDLNDNYILASDIVTYEDDTSKAYLEHGDTVQMEYYYYDENGNDIYIRSNIIVYENKAPTSPALLCTLNKNGTWSYKVYNGSSYSDGNWYLYADDDTLIAQGFIMPGETDTDLSEYMSEGAGYYLKITMNIDSTEFIAYSDTIIYIKEDIGGGDKYITTHLTIENTGSNYNFIISHTGYNSDDVIWGYTINIYDQNEGDSPLVVTKTIEAGTVPSVGLTVLATDIYSGWSYQGYYKVEVISDVMDYSDTRAEDFLIWEYN